MLNGFKKRYMLNVSNTKYKVWGIITMILAVISAGFYIYVFDQVFKIRNIVRIFSQGFSESLKQYATLYILICTLLVIVQFSAGIWLTLEHPTALRIYIEYGVWHVLAAVAWGVWFILSFVAYSFIEEKLGAIFYRNILDDYFSNFLLFALIKLAYNIVTAVLLFFKGARLVPYHEGEPIQDYQNQSYAGQDYQGYGQEPQEYQNQSYAGQDYQAFGQEPQDYQNQSYAGQDASAYGENPQSDAYHEQVYEPQEQPSQEPQASPEQPAPSFVSESAVSEEPTEGIQQELDALDATIAVEPAGKIVGLFGSFMGQEYPMENGSRCVVGRAPGCNIVLEHSKVSRIHCTIRRTQEGTYQVTDSSSNGTYHENEKLERGTACEVPSGALLVIGDADNVIQLI